MKIAIKKSPAFSGSHLEPLPLVDNFHFFVLPLKLTNDGGPMDWRLWELLGYDIVDIDVDTGERLLKESSQIIKHQLELQFLLNNKEAE